MIKAETAYNVFQALPESEQARFMQMCNVVPAEPKEKPIMSDEQAMDYLLAKLNRSKRRRKEKATR